MDMKTLTDAGLQMRLNDSGGVSALGLDKLPVEQAEQLRTFIKKHKDALVQELRDQTPGYSIVAARELVELCRMKMIRLHTDDKGGMWWSAPGYENDAASLCFVANLWGEGVMVLFEWKDKGKLNEFLDARGQNSKAQAESDPQSAIEPAKQAAPRQTQLQFDCVAPDSEQ